jgi:hypothetical protein
MIKTAHFDLNPYIIALSINSLLSNNKSRVKPAILHLLQLHPDKFLPGFIIVWSNLGIKSIGKLSDEVQNGLETCPNNSDYISGIPSTILRGGELCEELSTLLRR